MTKTAATKFQVRWRKDDEPDTLWSSPVDVGKDGNVKVPGLERVADYVFQARAGSECGAWSDWVVQTFNMPEAAAPEAVSSLTAQSVADGVHLSWASIIADGGTVFSIERSTSASSGFAERAQTRATAYTDPETSGTVFYYRVRAVNYRGSFGPYSNVVSSQGVAVDALGDDVAAAQQAAANAQQAADAANTQLADIASDSVLSPAEKPNVARDYSVITTEQAGIDGQADAYGITTEKTAYDNAVSALTAYLATLTSPTAWNDKSGNTTIVAATFKSYFTSVYTTRQTLLNAIYATAKGLADNAQSTANIANTTAGTALTNTQANVPLVNNPYFSTGDLTGWTSDHGSVYFESGTNGPASGSTSYAVFPHGTAAEALRNAQKIPVYPGARIKAQCAVRGVGTPNGVCGVRISWRDASDTELSTTAGTTSTGNATNGTYVTGTASAGAMFAHVECYTASRTDTTGYYTVDNFWAALLPDSIDQVPDGTSRFAVVNGGGLNAVSAVDPNKKALIDFTQTGHTGKSLANVPDDPTSTRYAVGAIDGNRRALIDFSQSAHVNKTMDYIGDSASRFAAIHTPAVQAGIYQPGANLLPNPSFALGTKGFLGMGNWISANIGTPIGTCAQITLNSTPQTSVLFTETHSCAPGQPISASLSYQINGTMTAGDLAADLQFYNSSGTLIGTSARLLTASSGIFAPQSTSIDNVNPPTGAATFNLRVYVENATGSLTCYVWNLKTEYGAVATPINDRASQYGNQATVPNTGVHAYADFTDNVTGGHVGKHLGNVPDDPTSTRYAVSNIDSNRRALIDFSQGAHLGKNQDNIGAGSTYGQTALTDLYTFSGVSRVGLRVAGSGHRPGDLRNSLQRAITNVPASVPAAPSYSAAAGSPATATISVPAFTVQAGSVAVAYNASSVGVTGTGGNTVTYYLYFNDPNYTGGTQVLNATTSGATIYAGDGYVYVGSIQVTFPTSGSGSGGGSGGGGACVVSGSHGPLGLIDADSSDVMTPTGSARIRRSYVTPQNCVRVECENGATLSCSFDAPLMTEGGRVLAPQSLGETIHTSAGLSRVTAVHRIGIREVIAIDAGDVAFYAGESKDGPFILHHNKIIP